MYGFDKVINCKVGCFAVLGRAEGWPGGQERSVCLQWTRLPQQQPQPVQQLPRMLSVLPGDHDNHRLGQGASHVPFTLWARNKEAKLLEPDSQGLG